MNWDLIVWSRHNFLSLNLVVSGQAGGTGALIKPLRPTASSRNTSCSTCLCRTPRFPCGGIVASSQPLCNVEQVFRADRSTGDCSPKDQEGPHLSLLHICQ